MTFGRALIITCAMAAAASPAFAQRWGHERTPHDGACFYRDADFRGEYFCIPAGDMVGSLPREMNDQISSIRIFGRTEVNVYRDHNLNGRHARFERDVHNLRNQDWNDTISSLQVLAIRGSGDHGEHGGYGASREAERIVTRAYQDVLGRSPDSDGMRIYRSHIIEDGWSDARVREALRDSREYREKNAMTYPKAQEIVRRAYLNILKREPDYPGANGYVNRVMKDHWTQADVEQELRKAVARDHKR
jgi:Peptidase inhibitor family I36